ncbi:hypothetical protein ACWD4B_12865 [Streptomyces sp. NPDC002536]
MALLPYPRTVGDTTLPFWHRREPQLTALHLDPSYERLKAAFPAAWKHLVKVKALLDGITLADTNEAFTAEEHAVHARGAAAAIGAEFAAMAEAEDRPGTVTAARESARMFTAYAETGEWPSFVVHHPVPGEPWLYCGPLNSWGSRTTRMPVSLLVSVEDPANQVHVDRVDAAFETIVATVTEALGTTPHFVETRKPTMRTMDLLLGGGEMSFGHKNFAHFFPLESPGGSVTGDDFTVVFANVHHARLEQVSLPLLRAALGDAREDADLPLDRVLAAHLGWFRCHDFGHFWRMDADAGKTWAEGSGLTFFELMSLEETYADTLGLLCARHIVDTAELSVAYNAELVRYLTRDHRKFADTVAAEVEIGWLAEAGLELPDALPNWLDKSSDTLAELARLLHRTLWEQGAKDVSALSRAAEGGRAVTAALEGHFDALPTDLVFVQG